MYFFAVLVIPFVIIPVCLIGSIFYVCVQKHWQQFLYSGAIGAAAGVLLCQSPFGMTFGFPVGVAYLSFFKPPISRRQGAGWGWAAGMALGTSLTQYLSGPNTVWSGSSDYMAALLSDLLFFGSTGGLSGALLGLWLDRVRQ